MHEDPLPVGKRPVVLPVVALVQDIGSRTPRTRCERVVRVEEKHVSPGRERILEKLRVPAKLVNSGTIQGPGSTTSAGFFNLPSSNHPGGGVAGFCDGHTEFLKDSLSARTYMLLLNTNNSLATGTWCARTDILNEGEYK